MEYPKVSRVPSLLSARPFRVASPHSNRGGPLQRSVARITGREDLHEEGGNALNAEGLLRSQSRPMARNGAIWMIW